MTAMRWRSMADMNRSRVPRPPASAAPPPPGSTCPGPPRGRSSCRSGWPSRCSRWSSTRPASTSTCPSSSSGSSSPSPSLAGGSATRCSTGSASMRRRPAPRSATARTRRASCRPHPRRSRPCRVEPGPATPRSGRGRSRGRRWWPRGRRSPRRAPARPESVAVLPADRRVLRPVRARHGPGSARGRAPDDADRAGRLVPDAGREFGVVDAGPAAGPAHRDPERAFPKRLVGVYGAIAAASILLGAAPSIIAAPTPRPGRPAQHGRGGAAAWRREHHSST